MWPATSKHLRILRDAGLVASWSQGASRCYRLDRAALAPVLAWAELLGATAR
jgi:DNA-binding transcriptional ArsR family regulator